MWHLGKFYPPASGGIETHVRALAQEQAKLGLEVAVACVNHAARDGRDVTFELLARTERREERDGAVRVLRLGRVASVARLDVAPGVVGLLEALRREPPDVVHLHSPNPTMLLALAARPPSGSALVITHHSDVVRQRVLAMGFSVVERRVYARAALILATSPRYADGSRVLTAMRERVRSLPLGIDVAPFARPSAEVLEAERAARARFGSPLWLGVGRLVYYKGFEVALEALARAPGTLAIAGTGPLREALERRARALGVSDRVAFLGHVPDAELRGLYRAATALWFPSLARSEGYGLAQVEAMASGCPVINTLLPGSGVPWVSPHEQTGLSVPVRDAPALAAAAARLASDAALRPRLSAAAVERATKELSAEVMGARCVEMYREVLGRPREQAG
ncbi:MAG TPA: glycosyltransferase [Myxococcaceae bacterium]|nr:glycosyltransferase [Myxococcaceae bacterium]